MTTRHFIYTVLCALLAGFAASLAAATILIALNIDEETSRVIGTTVATIGLVVGFFAGASKAPHA